MINENYLKIFQALSSETRLKIIELLLEKSSSITEMSDALNVSQVIITRHIAQLEEAGLVTSNSIPGIRGSRKLCALTKKLLTINFEEIFEKDLSCEKISIPVGSFSKYKVAPSCGVANKERIIGIPDDERYFSSPERYDAGIVWFNQGWVEYTIPSYLFTKEKIKKVKITMEVCSEIPYYKNDFPSDIFFYLNEKNIGIYQSPGDFGDRKGKLTPSWWNMGSEYGLIVEILITDTETFINGVKNSSFSIKDIIDISKSDILFKISSPKDCENPGGINLFGKTFGDYEQDIVIKVFYE